MIGAALGWKFGYAEGIETRDGIITKWPEALGAVPEGMALAAILNEYWAWRDKTNKLRATETIGGVARRLEEVIDWIENGTPLSPQARSWMTERKAARE